MSVASPQSFNRYSYVNNDPVNSIDPSGLMLKDIGVEQTNDPEEASSLQRASDVDFQRGVNADYAARHGGTVSYDKEDGHATFRSNYSRNLAAYAPGDMSARRTGTFFSGLGLGQQPSSSQNGDDVVRVTGTAYATKADYDLAVSPVEVLIVGPGYHSVQSIAGHMAYVINGTVWSWQLHGWHYFSKAEFLKDNDYRTVTGYVLEFGPKGNMDFKDAIKGGYDNKGYRNLPFFGQYRLQQNNCGEAFCRAMNAMGNHGWEGGETPHDHEIFINDNLRANILSINHYH